MLDERECPRDELRQTKVTVKVPAPEAGMYYSSGRINAQRPEKVGVAGLPPQDDDGQDEPHHIGHLTAGTVIIGEMVGAGIITLPAAFSKLGWFWGIFFLVLNTVMFLIIGHFLLTAYLGFPSKGIGELAENLFGNRWARLVVEAMVFIYCLFTASGYLVGASESLGMAFFDVELCGIYWQLIVLGLLIAPTQLRSFGEQRVILWINVAALTIAILIALVFMGLDMRSHHKADPSIETSFWLPPLSGWTDVLMGMAQITFAFCASFIFPAIMHSMKQPTRFRSTINIVGLCVFTLYMVVACVGYSYGGQSSSAIITAAIDYKAHPIAFTTANILLVFHLVVAYVILGLVCLRIFAGYFAPEVLIQRRCFSCKWAVFSFMALGFTFLIANSLPLFDSITAIIGSLLSPCVGFLLPVVFFIKAKRLQEGFKKFSVLQLLHILSVIWVPIILVPFGTTANFLNFSETVKQDHVGLFQCQMESYAMKH